MLTIPIRTITPVTTSRAANLYPSRFIRQFHENLFGHNLVPILPCAIYLCQMERFACCQTIDVMAVMLGHRC